MTEPSAAIDAQSVGVIWIGLGEYLADRFRQLNDEIRHYPTPIARCDDQLPKLIEQRDHVRAELERMRAIEASFSGMGAPTPAEIERFLDAAPPADDETELDFRARLEAAACGARS